MILNLDNKLYIENKYYGANQAWFRGPFNRLAGCGIVASTNLLRLIGVEEDKLKIDYTNIQTALDSMILVNKFVKPGPLGINSSAMLSKQLNKLVKYFDLNLTVNELMIDTPQKNGSVEYKYIDFIQNGLAENGGVAFLNLDSAELANLSNWHWVTITGLEINSVNVLLTISDEGYKKTIDFSNWYSNTSKRGGLVYLSRN